MSLEPPPTAEVVLRTSKGDLAIELWAKEAPQTCRRFIERCRAGAYVGQPFGRISKQSLIQVEDPRARFDLPLETHARLKFGARGMLGAVRGDAASTVDSFFVTCRAAPELNGTHTVFGRVVGASYYTVVAIHDGEVESDGETAVFPVGITASEVTRELPAPAPEAAPEAAAVEAAKTGKPPPTPKTEAVAAPRRPRVKLSLDFEDDSEAPLKVRSAFEPSSKEPRADMAAKEDERQQTASTKESPETPRVALGEGACERDPGGQDAAAKGVAAKGAAAKGAAAKGADATPADAAADSSSAVMSAATVGDAEAAAPTDVPSVDGASVIAPSVIAPSVIAPSVAAPVGAAATRRCADPIDSDYDPYLDLASEEEISPQATLTHVWP